MRKHLNREEELHGSNNESGTRKGFSRARWVAMPTSIGVAGLVWGGGGPRTYFLSPIPQRLCPRYRPSPSPPPGQRRPVLPRAAVQPTSLLPFAASFGQVPLAEDDLHLWQLLHIELGSLNTAGYAMFRQNSTWSLCYGGPPTCFLGFCYRRGFLKYGRINTQTRSDLDFFISSWYERICKTTVVQDPMRSLGTELPGEMHEARRSIAPNSATKSFFKRVAQSARTVMLIFLQRFKQDLGCTGDGTE